MKNWASIDIILDGTIVSSRKADDHNLSQNKPEKQRTTKTPSQSSPNSYEDSLYGVKFTPEFANLNDIYENDTSNDIKLPKKRARHDLEMSPSLINKILNGSSGVIKKKENPHILRRTKIDAPSITYLSKGQYSCLRLPPALPMLKILHINPPKARLEKDCICGKKARYRLPKSLKPYCGLVCFKQLQLISN